MVTEIELKSILRDADHLIELEQKIIHMGGVFVNSQDQKTFYYDHPDAGMLEKISSKVPGLGSIIPEIVASEGVSFRIRQNNDDLCQVIVKLSVHSEHEIHGNARKEFEQAVQYHNINDLDEYLIHCGFHTDIKWHRLRKNYTLHDCNISLDENFGVGVFCEIEQISSQEYSLVISRLRELMKKLDLEEASSDVLKKMFIDYSANWTERYYSSYKN